MSNYVISINERMTLGKAFLEHLKFLNRTSDFVSIVLPEKEKTPYNSKFVKEIERSMKSKGKSIKLEDLWK